MHSEWTDRLSEYLDGELDPAATRALESHLAACAECRAVRDELKVVVATARGFEGRPPSKDLWSALEAEIERSRVVALPRRFDWRHLIAAGLVMGVVGSGAALIVARRLASERPAAPAVATQPPTIGPRPAVVLTANADYDRAVRDLEAVVAAGRATLDTATVRVVEESLKTIDQAIAEAEAAVQRDPANAYLNGQIAAHMQQKLAILRMATRAIQSTS
jgi:Putative zinc-finger